MKVYSGNEPQNLCSFSLTCGLSASIEPNWRLEVGEKISAQSGAETINHDE